MVPPHPVSGSSGCAPATTTFSLCAGGAIPRGEFSAALSSGKAAAMPAAPLNISRRDSFRMFTHLPLFRPISLSVRPLIGNPLPPVPRIGIDPIQFLSRPAARHDIAHDLHGLFHGPLG